MLIELFGQNFGSFRDEFRLSMLATDIDPDSQRGILEVHIEGDDEPLRLLRAVALYGPNGSGKSTLLRAANALGHLLGNSRRFPSDEPLRPYEPFALGPQSKQPVVLGIKAVIDSVVYEYVISFDRRAFATEKLIRLSGDKPGILFDRVGQNVEGQWTSDPQFQLLSKEFRPNALLLSLADSLTPKLAKSIAVGLRRMLTTNDATPVDWPFNRVERVAARTREDAVFGGWLLARLKSADVGVVDLRAEEVRTVVKVEDDEDSASESGESGEQVHVSMQLALLHSGSDGPVALPYSRESLGTRRLVELSPLLYDLAHDRRSRALFVDEFDASMHPLLLQAIVRHFNCETPIKDARGQLIFATHETTLLDDEAKDAVLRRDQVYFTAKDVTGASRLYSVAEFKERNNLNIRRRYLQGRYGALPSLGTFTE